MTHERTLIKHAVKAIMLNAITEIEDRIYLNRTLPFFPKDLPAILITTGPETMTLMGPPYKLKRTFPLEITVVADGDQASDDTLENIAVQVEQLIALDAQLKETASSCYLEGVSATHIKDQGKEEVGALALTFETEYITEHPRLIDQTLHNLETSEFSMQPKENDAPEGTGSVDFPTE